ncbi:MAG: hypothetical protein Q9214_005328 [Letrouitia sp. 1 TL-2023]
MYLLNTSSLQLHLFQRIYDVNYAILSHTWGEGEVSFEQLQSGNYNHLAGYRKIKAACDLASKDGWGWVWIDTCCIDKKSSAELSEAINSMYLWYKVAVVCYAYLEDVSLKAAGHKAISVRPSKTFQESRWFTRGWTLQELLAPRLVIFYDRDWIQIGSKSSLQAEVSVTTGIGIDHLRKPQEASAAQKLSWASQRSTTRQEDEAYCLLGLFDVNMPLVYGEGRKAFRRLQEEIINSSNDHSVFAWDDISAAYTIGYSDFELSSMLASSPKRFIHSGSVAQCGESRSCRPCSFVNRGVSIMLKYARSQDLLKAGLEVSRPGRDFRKVGAENVVGAILECQNQDGYRRVLWLGISPLSTETEIKAYRIMFQGHVFLNCQELKDLRLREKQFYVDSSNRPPELKGHGNLSRFTAPFTLVRIRSLSPESSRLSLNQYEPATRGYFSMIYGQVYALLHHRSGDCAIYLSICHLGAKYDLRVAWKEYQGEMLSFKLEISNGIDRLSRQTFTELLQNSGCIEMQLSPNTFFWAEISIIADNHKIDYMQAETWTINLDISSQCRSAILNPMFQKTETSPVGVTNNLRDKKGTFRTETIESPRKGKILMRTDSYKNTGISQRSTPRPVYLNTDVESAFFELIRKTFPEALFWKA